MEGVKKDSITQLKTLSSNLFADLPGTKISSLKFHFLDQIAEKVFQLEILNFQDASSFELFFCILETIAGMNSMRRDSMQEETVAVLNISVADEEIRNIYDGGEKTA